MSTHSDASVGNASIPSLTPSPSSSASDLPLILVSYAVGGTIELLFALIRRHEINEGFLVTGILYPLTLPATLPLWQAAIGIAFGVIVGKEVFGGSSS